MVAPVAAAAASRLGPAIRSTGGKWMHSSKQGIRSMGGKMLGTTDAKVAKNIEKVTKFSDMSVKLISKISKGVAKVLSFLSKHSPALKQQLVVIGKAFSVMIRPIGDIMARFLRPMAVWVMKVAQKWYAMVTKRKKGGMEDLADKEEQLVKSIEAGKAFGIDTTKQEDELAQLRAGNDMQAEGGDGPLAKLWKNLIPEAFKETLSALGETFKGLWSIIKEVGLVVWDLIKGPLERLAGGVGLVLLGTLKTLTFLFEGIGVVLKAVGLGIKTVHELFQVAGAWLKVFGEWIGKKFVEIWQKLDEKVKAVWNWLKTVFIIGWETLKDKMSNLASWLKETFIGAWDKLKSTFQTLVDKVMGWVDKIKNAWGNIKDKVSDKVSSGVERIRNVFGSKAVGGEINKTGAYMLHAGERVLTAGENSRTGMSSNTFNTTVNLQATINNELDIQMVARKLAELNETELRRRVSYF